MAEVVKAVNDLFGESIGFTFDRKAYKQDPTRYKGLFGDLMMVLRVAMTNQQQTPDLYDLIQMMGVERARSRIEKAKGKMGRGKKG